MNDLNRRDFLKASAAIAAASATGGFGCIEIASAQPIQVPTVDKLTMRVLVDPGSRPVPAREPVKVWPTRRPGPAQPRFPQGPAQSMGAVAVLESQRGQEQRTVMLDFGYTAEALLNNMEL